MTCFNSTKSLSHMCFHKTRAWSPPDPKLVRVLDFPCSRWEKPLQLTSPNTPIQANLCQKTSLAQYASIWYHLKRNSSWNGRLLFVICEIAMIDLTLHVVPNVFEFIPRNTKGNIWLVPKITINGDWNSKRQKGHESSIKVVRFIWSLYSFEVVLMSESWMTLLSQIVLWIS